jgi:hypothetical protein
MIFKVFRGFFNVAVYEDAVESLEIIFFKHGSLTNDDVTSCGDAK